MFVQLLQISSDDDDDDDEIEFYRQNQNCTCLFVEYILLRSESNSLILLKQLVSFIHFGHFCFDL